MRNILCYFIQENRTYQGGVFQSTRKIATFSESFESFGIESPMSERGYAVLGLGLMSGFIDGDTRYSIWLTDGENKTYIDGDITLDSVNVHV